MTDRATRPAYYRRCMVIGLGIALMTVTACGRFGGGAGGPAGIRQVGDKTIVTDALGPRLVIDGDGCQSIVPAAGGTPVPVRDAAGRQVCAAPGA